MSIQYNKKIINRFLNPKHGGALEGKDVVVGISGSLSCGDMLKLFLLVENNYIKKVRFLVFGCTTAFAASEYLAEMITNKPISFLKTVTNEQITEYLKPPRIKIHCSVMAEEALQDALSKMNNVEKNDEDNNYIPKENHMIYREEKKERSQSLCEEKQQDYVILTPRCLDQLAKFFNTHKEKSLLVFTVGNQCGFSYSYHIIEKTAIKTERHIKIFEHENFQIFSTKNSIKKMGGLTIDFIKNDLTSKIIFEYRSNETCRCGAMFK